LYTVTQRGTKLCVHVFFVYQLIFNIFSLMDFADRLEQKCHYSSFRA